MDMKKYYLLCMFALIFLSGGIYAGDIFNFTNLGFSSDGSVFMFGQYGIQEEDSRPYAESYIVDIADNSFVSEGSAQLRADTVASLGQNGSGALFNLLNRQSERIKQYGIDHLVTGRLVYLLVNGGQTKDEISFRDFNTGTAYTLRLIQFSRSPEDSPEAAFHIIFDAKDSTDNTHTQIVGLPNYYRKSTSSYAIKQVIISPNEKSLVVVIEKILDKEDGRYLRYMVETIRLYN